MKKCVSAREWRGLMVEQRAVMLVVFAVMTCALPARDHPPLLQAFTFLIAAMLNGLAPRELFSRCASVPNDVEAWNEFFSRYRNDVCVAIYRIIGFPPQGRFLHLFEDVMQRFNQRLLDNNRRALHAFWGSSEVQARAYLRKIAASVAIRMLTNESAMASTLPAQESDEGHAGPRQPGLPDRSLPSEDFILLRETIERCLERVLKGRNKYRNALIFKLAVFQGHSAEEISHLFGPQEISRHAIEQQISRTRQKVRKCLET